jgi:vacuolar protein sorting-associated protein 45
MVHEILGIGNNRVSLKGGRDVRKELEDVVLSVDADDFFSHNLTLNFGDLGAAVMRLVEQYQERVHVTQRIDSIGMPLLSVSLVGVFVYFVFCY